MKDFIWKTISLEDLGSYIFEPQFKNILQYAANSSKIVGAIMEDVISSSRAQIHGSCHNELDNDYRTVPPEARQAIIYLIIEALQSRVPGLSLTDDQKENAKNARALLRRIGKGEVMVSRPTGYIGGPGSALYVRHVPVNSFSTRYNRINRGRLENL